MNARETLVHVADWLGWQDEPLSSGLHNAFDGLRLYDYWVARQDRLDEMADEWEPEERITALGYDPMADTNNEAKTSGADVVVTAMERARKLLDSVACVTKEGDTRKPLALLNAALGRTI
jgi:hypothetical protein